MSKSSSTIADAAWQVIEQSATPFGFVATAQDKDNYARLWSRDSAITSLAVLAGERTELYPTVYRSIVNLLDAVGEYGVFPSNVSFSDQFERTGASFGGPVGRTDSPFWWGITALSYLERVEDAELKQRVLDQLVQMEQRAHAWEFNNKHLMYAPVSSNWADEYPVEGYILLNNVLRYWMLRKAGRIFEHKSYTDKANAILWAIKSHFFGEPADTPLLFTKAQQERLDRLTGGDRVLMSFTPGALNNHMDALGLSIAFLVGAASESTMNKVVDRWMKGPLRDAVMPAHWPIIRPGDPLWPSIESNYSFDFKNHPGHFHNGGVWGLTQGFAAAMFKALGREEADLLGRYEELLQSSMEHHPFAEYYSYPEFNAAGVHSLCFSAASYLLATHAESDAFLSIFERVKTMDEGDVQRIASELATEIVALRQTKIYKLAGESGCGKTTLGKALVEALKAKGKKALLLSQDEFFHLPPRQNHNKRVSDFSWIGPQEVDFELLQSCLEQATDPSIEVVKIPVMNWERDEKEWKEVSVTDVDAIVVEGTYVLHQISNDETGIFFEHTYEDTKEARIARNREVVDDFIQRVLAREHELISPQAAQAHFSISKEYKLH